MTAPPDPEHAAAEAASRRAREWAGPEVAWEKLPALELGADQAAGADALEARIATHARTAADTGAPVAARVGAIRELSRLAYALEGGAVPAVERAPEPETVTGDAEPW